MRVRRRHRFRKFLAWGTLVVLASLCGGLGFAYWYVTDSDTIARQVRAEAPRYLPGSKVDLGRARLRPFAGEIQLHQLMVRQGLDGSPFLALRIPWLSIKHSVRAMLHGKLEPTEVVVSQPTLRLRRRKDGTWNLQGLLASPWPGPVMKTPPVQILNGTLELSDGPSGETGTAILRDVSVRVVPGDRKGQLRFEGTAKGDTFDRLSVLGTVDVESGRVEFGGDLARLTISDALRGRIPAELRPAVNQLGLTAGEADLRINRVSFDPQAVPTVRYDVSGRLRGGVLNCPKLPFPLNDLAAGFAARDGVFTIRRAEGYYGTTTVRVEKGTFRPGDPETAPLEIDFEIVDLKMDRRLRERTPPQFDELWDVFQPSGRVSLAVHAVREKVGGPLVRKVTVDCLDVAMLYRHFKYPLDHIAGRFTWEGEHLEVENLTTIVGGQPVSARGTVDTPGPNAVVTLTLTGKAVPIDKTLIDALPPDVKKVVQEFHPTGTAGGRLTVHRTPPEKPGDDPKGKVAIDAFLDLNERCGIVWDGLPYPVNNLTGRFEIHPDLWIFKDMKGSNGQAELSGSGRVEKLGGTAAKPELKVQLHLKAEKLPCDEQLRAALQPAWQKTWAILNPTGSSDVDATIELAPGVKDRYHVVITPRPATSVTLKYTRPPKPGIDPGGTFDLPMDHITGRFVVENGPVDMQDVGFKFFGSPVQFSKGRVVVFDTGKFDLAVQELWAKDIRLDPRLRTIMPPVMGQFAQKLDDGRTFTLKGNMALGWSGLPNSPAWCAWDHGLVVFNANTVQVQPGLALSNIQGKLSEVRGRTDGEVFDVHGLLKLDSVSLLGQQITKVESPIDVDHGMARLDDLQGQLLGGVVNSKMSLTLDATPKYSAEVRVRGANLEQYARTQQGHQTYRGLVDAALELEGFGGDPRTLQGKGYARVVQGDLGELPGILSLVKLLSLSAATKTAFDSADVAVTVQNGKSFLEPIRFTGDAISLIGKGTMDVQGDLDLRLNVVYGRAQRRVLSDVMGGATSQFLVIRVLGTPSFPKPRLVPLPKATDVFKSIGRLGGGERQRK